MKPVFGWRDAPAADYAVIGHPVTHSLSPAMHAAAYAACELDLSYIAVDVAPEEVPQALDHLRDRGFRGVNVTVPHKAAALRWCTVAEPFALRADAANTIRLAEGRGINTDGPGFMAACAELFDRVTNGRDILMLGAGGSARAIALKIVEAGYPLRIWNRTRDRARELVDILESGASHIEIPDISNAALIINATSGSLSGDGLQLEWSKLEQNAAAVDLMYVAGLTSFLSAAKNAGCRDLVDGRRLLMEQGALSFEWWTGQEAPRSAMLEAIQ